MKSIAVGLNLQNSDKNLNILANSTMSYVKYVDLVFLAYISYSNATVFVMLILTGWHVNFHGIKSIFDAAGETVHPPVW